jgi:hypothetical protein
MPDPKFDVETCLKLINDALVEEGYKPRITQKATSHGDAIYYGCSYSHNERGVRFAISTIRYQSGQSDRIDVTMFLRSKRGTMRKAYHNAVPRSLYQPSYQTSYDWKKHCDEFIRAIPTIKGEAATKPKGRTQLSKPFRFDKPSLSIVPSFNFTVVARTHFFDSCRVLRPVTIADNLKISAEDVVKPNAESWFHIKGDMSGMSSGQPEMVVTMEDDELVFFPVMYGKVTTELIQEGSYINFNKVTADDAAIVRMAIDDYLAKS